jgi:hypothetical protein
MLQIAFDRFSLDVPPGWEDVTESAVAESITLARDNGVGKLRFSQPAGADQPRTEMTPQYLLERITSFGNERGLPAPQDVALESGPLRIAAASFSKEDEFLRAWQISDGSDLALATYACKLSDKNIEVADCEQIVRSLQFRGPDAAS